MQRRMSAFEFHLRTGRRLDQSQGVEAKFNPWHDPDDGRFTFANQGRYVGRGQSRLNDTGAAGVRVSAERSARAATAPSDARQTTPRPRSLTGAGANPPVRPRQPLTPRQLRSNQNSAAFLKDPKEALEGIRSEMSATESAPLPDDLVQRFKRHMIPEEDDRNDVYPDNLKIPTVGVGHRVVPADKLKLGDMISDARKEAFWRRDSEKALRAAQQQMDEAGIADPNFILPLASVNFQVGAGWNKRFKKTWALIMKGDYKSAAREAQDSLWYRQTPDRVHVFQGALRVLPPKQNRKK